MAFEKAKVLKAAEKFLSQGKINAAIKEYRQIVDNDQSDLTALNMLGDLCVRASKTDEAISCFQRIAEHYSEQEFTLKAIAMYKKIDRLKPRDPYIAHKLANLYGTQGLVVDARAQFLVVADAYTRAGQSGKALDIFHKIADLDPQNTEIRIKLAEGYLQENMRNEAASAFADAARRFHDTRAFEKSLEAYSNALKLAPLQNSFLRGFISAHIALGTADEAVEVLQREVEQRPDDRELVVMLVDACLEAEDAPAAERAVALLISQDSTDYAQLIPVAKLYLKLGEVDETVRVLTGIVEQMLAGREEKELLEIVTNALNSNPDHVGALRLLVRIHWWQRDMEALRGVLERMAEAAQAGGLEADERYALTQLLRLTPDEQKYQERLNELGGQQDDAAANDLLPADSFSEVLPFDAFASAGSDTPDLSGDHKQQFDWEVVTAEGALDPSASLEFSENDPNASFAELNESIDSNASFAELSDPIDSSASFAELNESIDSNASFAELNEPINQTVAFGEFETLPEDNQTSVAPEARAGQPADTGEEIKLEAMMRQELESVDFYLSQGYIDIAADTLDMLARQFGPHPEILSRRERLQDASAQTKASEPEVYDLGGDNERLAGKEVVATQLESSFEVALEPAVRTTASGEPVREISAPVGTGIDAGLAEIFEEFRIAAEEEQKGAREDFETHYNMGTAYKEMDLMDDAIHEFQTAASLVQPADGTSRFIQCCSVLAHCFVQKGMPRAAVMWFQKGLETRGHEEEQKALRYELAAVYELMGDLEQAHNLFSEVYGLDVSYREVGERLVQLEAKRKSNSKKK